MTLPEIVEVLEAQRDLLEEAIALLKPRKRRGRPRGSRTRRRKP